MKQVLDGRRISSRACPGGIGFETAKRFMQEGARVIGVARDESRLAAALEALRPFGDVSVVRADLGDPEAPAPLRDAVAKRWGALDILFNNAAIMENAGDPRSFEDEAARALADSLQANVLQPPLSTPTSRSREKCGHKEARRVTDVDHAHERPRIDRWRVFPGPLAGPFARLRDGGRRRIDDNGRGRRAVHGRQHA